MPKVKKNLEVKCESLQSKVTDTIWENDIRRRNITNGVTEKAISFQNFHFME